VSLLEVKSLVKHYICFARLNRCRETTVRAVDGVSLSLERGEALGLVGESGCGKSTFARLVTRMEDKTAGEIIFDGREISETTGKKLRRLRQHFQIIFQDPASSLNPRWKADSIIAEPLVNYGVPGEKRCERVLQLINLVGLEARDLDKYPHEFSGGQRQRINIARALALNPALLVCDEPISNLDVSMRAQVLNLLRDLKARFGLSYLFISHDLAAVSCLADRVAVMYLGQIVEIIPAKRLHLMASHPYTRALVEAVLLPDPQRKTALKAALQGEPPDPFKPPPGCRFHPRCPEAVTVCRKEIPSLKEAGEGALFACHLR